MTFQPLVNYTSYEHVLNAAACFIHPANGNLYGVAIEKQGGTRQNLSVYRVRPGNSTRELVKRYVGGVDSAAQIAMGGCVIHQDGSLEVWASAVPPGVPPVTKTGFQGVWDRIPNFDEPWGGGSGGSDPRVDALVSQLGAMSQQITQLETALANTVVGAGGMVMLPIVATSPIWEGRTVTGGVMVDVPAVFGMPSAAFYKIRFVALATRADVRVRAGTAACPFFVTMNTQVANLQEHKTGDTPGPLVWVSVVDNTGQAATARVWLQICGYSG